MMDNKMYLKTLKGNIYLFLFNQFIFIFYRQETVFEIFDRNIYHRRHKTGLRLPDDSV